MKQFVVNPSITNLPFIAHSFEYLKKRYYASVHPVSKSLVVYPSITTVLSTMSKMDFSKWMQNPDNAKKANRAAVQGSYFHRIMEYALATDDHKLLNLPDDDKLKIQYQNNPVLRNQVDKALVNFFKHDPNRAIVNESGQKEFLLFMQEQPVVSHILKVAGRLDMAYQYLTYNDIITMIDFKTISKLPAHPEKTKSYLTQLAFYMISLVEHGYRCLEGNIIYIGQNGEYEEVNLSFNLSGAQNSPSYCNDNDSKLIDYLLSDHPETVVTTDDVLNSKLMTLSLEASQGRFQSDRFVAMASIMQWQLLPIIDDYYNQNAASVTDARRHFISNKESMDGFYKYLLENHPNFDKNQVLVY